MTNKSKTKRPFIKWDQTGGPLLLCRDMTYRWITDWERFLLFFKLTTVEKIDKTNFK
jgi:hypothetical protein